MRGLKNFLIQNKVIVVIFFAALFLRLAFLSPWLEDWDSVQFALGIHDFNILAHQPHPPGYPLYILLGKLFYFLTQSDTKALTFLSVTLGSASVIPIYLLTKKMFNKKAAITASVLLAVLPVHWVISEIPTSNVPGFFLLSLLSYIAYVDVEEKRVKTLLGVLGGIALGIRATDLPIILGLFTFSAFKRRNLKYISRLMIGFLFGVSIWLIPLVVKTGPQEFIKANAETKDYVIWHDMLLGKTFNLATYLNDRLINSFRMLNIGFTPLFFTVSIFSSVSILLKRGFWEKKSYQLLGLLLFVYGIPFLFLYNLELAQYTLPLSIPFVVLVSQALSSLKGQGLSTILILFITLNLFSKSSALVEYQKSKVPPTIAPVLFVKSNYSKEETILITTFTFRQFGYYASEFKNYYGVANAPKKISAEYVIIDYKELENQIPSLSGYALIDERHFGPSQNQFSRLKNTSLYILKKDKNN